MKKCLTFVIPALIGMTVLLPLVAGALNINEGMNEMGNAAGFSTTTSLPTAIGRIINIVLSVLGLIATIFIIIAGFQWMTSGGSEEKIKTGKQTIVWAIIGMAFIFFSYAIVEFILKAFVKK